MCASIGAPQAAWLLKEYPHLEKEHRIASVRPRDTVQELKDGRCDMAVLAGDLFDLATVSAEYNRDCSPVQSGHELAFLGVD